jgi:polyisoprenyl-phosphate glycosyltransferase
MKTLTVVVPLYNEEEVVDSFHAELTAVLAGLSERYASTVLFVVDRSTDGTLDALRGIAAADDRVQVLALSSRFGHQMSLLAGIDHALTDVVVTMDGDLEHPPELIPTLLQRFEEGFDIVQATRLERPGTPFLKRKTSSLFYVLINRLAAIPITESGADYRLVSARVARVFRESIRERNQFVRGLTAWVGFPTTTVSYVPGLRSVGRTKYSYPRMLRLAIDGIVAFSRRPLQAAVYVGLLLATASFAFGMFTIVSYLVGSHFPAGWATLSVLVTFFSGIQLIFLGVIGEYIGTIFDEVKQRPHYIVEEAINVAAGAGRGEVPQHEARA